LCTYSEPRNDDIHHCNDEYQNNYHIIKNICSSVVRMFIDRHPSNNEEQYSNKYLKDDGNDDECEHEGVERVIVSLLQDIFQL